MITILLMFLIIGCYTDIKYQVISNYLTFSLMAVGLAYNIWAGHGLFYSLLGIAAGFVLFLLPFMLVGMGAGDVKLMMGVGAVLGWQNAIYAGVLSSILFAIYAIISLSRQGKFKELMNTTTQHTMYILTKNYMKDYSREVIEGHYIPYAIPITISTICVLVWHGGWVSLGC